jgi:hypothetical protein
MAAIVMPRISVALGGQAVVVSTDGTETLDAISAVAEAFRAHLKGEGYFESSEVDRETTRQDRAREDRLNTLLHFRRIARRRASFDVLIGLHARRR